MDSEPAWIAAIALATVLAFSPHLANDWVFDDSAVIVGHPAVLHGPLSRALLSPFWPPGTSADKLYRPLTTASYHVEAASTADGRPDAARTHATNLALHLVASVSVFLLARSAGLPGAAAGLAGVLFAVHPIHTEAVVTGYGRAELLTGMAGALLFWWILRVPPERRTPKDVALSTALFVLAVGAKENGLLLWPAVFVLDLDRRRRLPKAERTNLRTWISEVLPSAHVGFAVATVLFLLVRWTVLGGAFRLADSVLRPWEDPLAGATAATRGLTALRLLWLTARLLVDPRALCPLWSYPALAPASSWSADVLAGAALAAVCTVAGIVGFRRRTQSAALAAALLPLLWIVLHLPPAPHWIFAERWLYLPTVVLCVIAAVPFRRVPRPVTALSAVLIGVLLIPVTREYGRVFASDLEAAEATVARLPDGFQGVRHLAFTHLKLGHWSEAVALGRTLESRHGSTPDSEWLILNGSLGLRDRAAAEGALLALQRRFPGDGPRVLRDLGRRVASLPATGEQAPSPP